MYYGARGIVGLVKPTYRPGSMESFIKLMPEGVGFIPAHAGIRAGNEKELQEALTVAERKVARLAELGELLDVRRQDIDNYEARIQSLEWAHNPAIKDHLSISREGYE